MLIRILAAVPQWALPLLAGLGINTAVGKTLHQAPVIEPEPIIVEEKKIQLATSFNCFTGVIGANYVFI